MEKIILYHGSNVEVRNPRIINTNKGLDFGSGFYVTSDMKQAKRWSILKEKRRGTKYDVISGPVANDRTILTINDYISGVISAKTALILLEPANLTDQYAFLTYEGIHYTYEVMKLSEEFLFLNYLVEDIFYRARLWEPERAP